MKAHAITPMPAAAVARPPRVMRVVTPVLFALDIRGHQFNDLTLSEILDLHRATGLALETAHQPHGLLTAAYGVVVAICSEEFGIHVDRFTAKSREARYAFPRQVAMFLLREQSDGAKPLFSTNAIGELFRRDHGTVLHAVQAVNAAAATQPVFRARLQKLRTAVAAALQPEGKA